MPAEPLNQAAAGRHRPTVERAERALRALDGEGAHISFQSVARRAGVSRQWLYTQPTLRAEIERLRDRPPAASGGIPARQRASEASLRQRLETSASRTSGCARRTRPSRPSSPSPTANSVGHAAPDHVLRTPRPPVLETALGLHTALRRWMIDVA